MEAAYPIHPELFDRLYNDWGGLDKFQRTRGVLRLMASVIHKLWEGQDGGLLILPASVPPNVAHCCQHGMPNPLPVSHTNCEPATSSVAGQGRA
jgi:predicted AAA+ superfamily ATPase